MSQKKNKISILIPCYNEEKSIRQCVDSCLSQTRKADEIVVVNDASTDGSLEILKSFGRRIKLVNVTKRIGNKSYVQEHGLKFVTGDIFIATDGDTVLDKNFVRRIEEDFKDKKIAAVSGYVRSLKHNWLTALRELDYAIGQRIHKTAQSYIDSLLVIPGCAGAFRTEIFRKHISFDHDTLTEDLDFTYKLHEKGFKIKFDKKAIVYTQDPADLNSYVRQMRRWYGGGWQNLRKHSSRILHRPKNVLELSIVYLEGLVFSALLFLGPLLNLYSLKYLILPYLVTMVGLAVYASLAERRVDLLIFSPFYLLLVFLNAWIFLYEFVSEIVLRRENKVWLSAERRVMA